MRLHEELSWILDMPGGYFSDEGTVRNKEFVHSMGRKCDAVGWSHIDLSEPGAGRLLAKIDDFCRVEGFLARGWYSRRFEELDSDWYVLDLRGSSGGAAELTSDTRCPLSQRVYTTKAYQNREQPILFGCYVPMVSEAFRTACRKHGIFDVDFCWIRDTGRYASSQYFFLYPQSLLPALACASDLEYYDYGGHPLTDQLRRRYDQLGGWLPRLSQTFHELHFGIGAVPNCYPAAGLPETGFACACWETSWMMDETSEFHELHLDVLIHQDTAETLMREKVLHPGNLRPARLYTQIPEGYFEKETVAFPMPDQERRDALLAEYERFKRTDKRPRRKATDKEAVKQLRLAKHQRKEEFAKAMRRAVAPSLDGTPYEPLAPYYLVAHGGTLSDEYELLSYEQAQAATREFAADMEAEELEETPVGVVFVVCPDGDKVLLRTNGTVSRFSHEEPVAEEEWPSLAQFFVDSLETD